MNISRFTVDLLSISWSHYEVTMNSLSISWSYYELTILSRISWEFNWCFAHSLWIQLVFRVYTFNSLYISRIHYLWHEFTMNSMTFSHTHYEFTIFSRVYYWFTIFIVDSSWIHLVFREFTINLLSISRIYYENHLCFIYSRIYQECTIFNAESLSNR